MEREIVIRIFKERYNTDPDYYLGYKDLEFVMIFKDFQHLEHEWTLLRYHFEGDTYSARTNDTGEVLCGGALDPDDLERIKEALFVSRN